MPKPKKQTTNPVPAGTARTGDVKPENDPRHVQVVPVFEPPRGLRLGDYREPEPDPRDVEVAEYAEDKRPPNALGLIALESDDCHHLNKTWKGGCCTIAGNRPCPYLGGNQRTCEAFVSRTRVLAYRESASGASPEKYADFVPARFRPDLDDPKRMEDLRENA